MDKEKDVLEVIDSYSRAQAIKDGTLVDVSETALKAGIRYPTALTLSVFQHCVAVPDRLVGFQDEQGRLWDILWMLRQALALKRNRESNELVYTVLIQNFKSGPKPVRLKAVCSAGDNLEPVITIMFPDED